MTILITGAGGFVGENLVNKLLSKGHEIVALVRSTDSLTNISKYKSDKFRTIIADLSKPIKIDFSVSEIVHLAAQIVYPSITETRFAEKNIVTMANTIRLAKQLNVKKFIFLSSVSVYGSPKSGILSEGSPLINPSSYGTSKYLGELMLSDLSGTVSVVNIRIPSVLGKTANPNFITKISESALKNEEFFIKNPKSLYNSTIHVDDVCCLINNLLEKKMTPFQDTINLACNNPIRLIDLAKLVVNELSSRSKIIIDETPSSSSLISIEKLTNEYNFIPMDVACAITNFLKDYKNL